MLTPAITLTVCWAAGLEKLTQPLVLSVALISAGTGAATLFETGGSAGFAWAGFVCFTFSALLEALRVVYIQLLLGRFKFNTLEVCVPRWCSGSCLLRLAASSIISACKHPPRDAYVPDHYRASSQFNLIMLWACITYNSTLLAILLLT